MKFFKIALIATILSSLCLQACSVGMALSGKKDPDLTVIKRGADRGEVELQIGTPTKVALVGEDTIAVYEYEIGNEPSAGRAVAHGAMDLLTLGFWEVIGTPVELINGDKYKLSITYDKDNKLKSVKNG